MSVFKEEQETKRVIFNVRLDLAERLEKAKENAKAYGKKLDVDTAIDKALEKFLKKAEKKMQELDQELRISAGKSEKWQGKHQPDPTGDKTDVADSKAEEDDS